MSVQLKPLSSQVIVITGATSGNGLATALEAGRRGAAVVLAARNETALEDVAARIRAGGGRAAICPADVARDEDVERIAAVAIEQFGGFDTWVNNAAAAAFASTEQLSMAEHRRIFDVNYFGLLKGSLVAAQHLRPKGGAIINLGSVLSEGTMILQGAYSASKHAIKAATTALRMELEREGAPISVTLIQPSAIHTPYAERARNYLGEPPRLPPLLYDPTLVADAILFAAEHRRRTLHVGSAGHMIVIGEAIAPQLSERLLETVGRRLQVSPGNGGRNDARDTLFEPKTDGHLRGAQPFFVRRTSYVLEAQKHPLLASMLVAGLGWALARTAFGKADGGQSAERDTTRSRGRP